MIPRPQGPSQSAGSNASGGGGGMRGSALRLKLSDAQRSDTKFMTMQPNGQRTTSELGALRPSIPTSAPTPSSPGAVGSQRRIVNDRRPHSGPAAGLVMLSDGDTSARASSLHDDDQLLERRSAAGSVAAHSRAASSAMFSNTSTALRAAAIATLERAIGHELPVHVRAAVRRVPRLDEEEGTDATQGNAEEESRGDEGAPVALPHVVLSAADVRAITDPETLKFLHENSLGFLKYVGESTTAAALPNPETRDQLLSSTGPRSSSRNALRASLGSAAGKRSHGADDIRVLTQLLCEDIATFITTLDSGGNEYVIATDRETGDVIVPVDMDDGNDRGDVGELADLDDFGEPDEGGELPDLAPRPDELQPPDTVTNDDDDATAEVASAFAEVLVKMRRDRVADERAQALESEATEVQRRLAEVNQRLGIQPSDEAATIDVEEDPTAPSGATATGEKPRVRGPQPSKAVAFKGGNSVPTPPRGSPASQTSSGIVDVAEVKLFTPTTRPPPNRRVEALLKFTTRDSRPNYMKPKAAVAQPAPDARPADTRTQRGTGAPSYKAGYARASGEQPDARTTAIAEEGTAVVVDADSNDGASVSPADAPVSVHTAPEIKPQRPQLTQRMENRIEWLLATDNYEDVEPNPEAAAGDDDAPTASDIHAMAMTSAFKMPPRVADIDRLLSAFAKERGGAGLPTPFLDHLEEDEPLDPTAPARTRALIADLDREEEAAAAAAVTPTVGPESSASKDGLVQSPQKTKRPPLLEPTTAMAELELQRAQRSKALGTQYMREVQEQRETRKAMNRINDRLSQLTSEVTSLYSAPFSVNRTHGMHQDPASWAWPGEQIRRPPEASRPTSAAASMAGKADAVVKPPPQSVIDRLVEEARREQIRARWTAGNPPIAVATTATPAQAQA